jgi:prepilin-type N-terminal cleavage/methylation domain-containing protein/prepilin-type processing-associated H-X9-DG protein
MTRPGRRPGFTLLELLMVIFIVGVILSLVLPSIQLAREAARRTQCVNNLKQTILALHNYQNTHESFPPGVVNASGPIRNVPEGYHFGWITQVLPFEEQSALAAMFDYSNSLYAPANLTVRQAVLSYNLCPSDPRPASNANVAVVAQGNYVGCHHDVEAPIAVDNHGVFYLNSRIRYEDLSDGSASTIFVGEKLRVGTDLGWASGTRASLRNTGSRINAGDLLFSKRPIPSWNDDGSAGGGPATLPDPTNADLVGGFSSNHPGGANFAFGDGSVRFLSESINRRIFQCLGNRADGELVDESSY